MSDLQDQASKREFVTNYIRGKIEEITGENLNALMAEFNLMISAWCKDKELPEMIGGNRASEGMMRAALHSAPHMDSIKIWMSNDVIDQLYQNITPPAKTNPPGKAKTPAKTDKKADSENKAAK
ncbi:MAG: hypothetical protein ACR2PR_06590 [Pseudohongiellaceae bacterium]